MKMDWNNLGFAYLPANSNIRFKYKNGTWDRGTLHRDDTINISIAATSFHYGQACFEGLKAFTGSDGKIRIFRPEENSTRLNLTCRHIMAPEVPEAMFIDAVKRVVKDNIELVPPYETNGSLYIRPLMIGTSALLGVAPAEEYEFIIFVTPVGAYYKGGVKPVKAHIVEDFDRAAPNGTGHIKVAGNYAASLTPTKIAKSTGAEIALFLDATDHKYIEEFGTSNFIGITRDGTYVTPDSTSILKSITNKSLMQIAKDCGLTVEQRRIPVGELEQFSEVGACGTAVVITPVREITSATKTYTYSDEFGPILKKLYEQVRGIQYGEKPDTHSWMLEV